MKNFILLFALLTNILIVGCNKDDDSSNTTTTPGGPTSTQSGTIDLSGDDTKDVGTQLMTGQIAYGRADLTGTEESIIIVDKDSKIDASGPVLADMNNGFVIVVKDGAISMNIIKNGVEYKYVCESNFAIFQNCGNLTFDIPNKKVTFNNSTVENSDTDLILTMNGQLSW